MPKLPSYRVPVGPDHKPSFFNKDTLLGGLVFGSVLGAIFGGFLGKQHQKNQQEMGKVVKPPTIWNKDCLIGGLIGGNLAVVPLGIAGLIGASSALVPLLVFAAGAILPLAAIGAFIGARRGKNKMAKEYAEAEAYVAQNGQLTPELGVAPSPSLAMGQEVPFSEPVDISQTGAQILPEDLQTLNASVRQGRQMPVEAGPARQANGNAPGRFTQQEIERAARASVNGGRSAA